MRSGDFPPKRKSPLDDLYEVGASAGGGGKGPLDDLYASPAVGTVAPGQITDTLGASPLDDLYGQKAPGAAQIAAQEQANNQENIEKLKKLLDKPGIMPAQRQRIEGMIKRYSEPSIGGFAVGNRVTEQRIPGSNLARGIGTGLVNYGILGASDILGAVGQFLLPKSWEEKIGLPEYRENIANSQQIVKDWLDPQGFEGGAGTVVGAIGSGFVPTGGPGTALTAALKPFEVLNSAGFKAVARLSPAAAAIVAKGTKAGAPFLSRLAAQAIGSGAVDAVQIADVLTNDQMPTEDKWRAVALTALASGGASMYGALRQIKPTPAEIADLKKQAKKVVAPAEPQAGAKPERAAEADALAAKATKNLEAAKLAKKLTRGARAEWEAQHLDKDWKKDLTEEQRTEIITKYKTRYAKTNISPADIKFSGQQIEKNLEVVKQNLPDLDPAQQMALATGLTNGEDWANTKLKELLAARKAAPAPETPSPTPAQPSPPAPEAGAAGAPPASGLAAAGVEGVGAGREGGPVAGAPEPPRAGEVAPDVMVPAEQPVDEIVQQLQAELATTRNQRDLAQREAETDAMTGVANINAWKKAITAANADPNTKFLLFDLLNVKYLNDKVSRGEADQYIIDAARAIETAARTHAADPTQTPRVFRYGGDEFAVLLPASADQEAIASTAKQILGQSVFDGYPTGLRHSTGATSAEAEAAMGAAKAGEKAPKYRPLASREKVEQIVPGVELKKPLSEHGVEELDKLYDAIDSAHEIQHSITDEAYAEGIRVISEAKRQLKRTGVKVESLEPAKRSEKASTAKADQQAKKDAGYRPEEKADPLVNEGHAIIDGKLQPVTREMLERIKTQENANIAKLEASRERLQSFPDRQLTSSEVDAVMGFGDNRGQSKGEVASFIERKIKAAKGEIDRYTRQHARYNEANPSHQPPPRANPADALIVRGMETADVAELRQPPELRKVSDPNIFRKQFSARLDKMSLRELEAHRDDLSTRLQGMTKKQEGHEQYSERLAKVNEAMAKKARTGDDSGVTLQTHPNVVGFAAGFALGFSVPADDDQKRWQNALYFGVGGALGTHLLRGALQRAKQDAVPDYQREIRGHVRSVEDAPLEKRKGIYSFLLEKYGNIARRDIGITATIRLSGGANLPAGRNAGKLTELFGLWRGMTDRWLFGDRVGTFDRDGNWVQFDSMTMQQIAGMVQGDLRTVGDLAAAKRELELRSMPEPRTTGISLETARRMYANTSEKYHAASVELTKFFRAMKDLSVMSGLISKETSAKMNEQTFYVAVRRLFGDEPGTTPGVLDVKAKKKSKGTGPENLFKGLKGGKRPYQNPVEAAIDLLPRYHRAGELNRMTSEFFDHLSAVPAEDRALIGRRLSKAETPKIADVDAKVQQLRDELSQHGSHISEAEATAIVTALSDESLNITNDVVRFYRNGEMEAWRVSEPIARAFRSLQPHELEAFMAGANLLTKPTNLARVGITANPVFVGYQAIRDIWQYHMNGSYGLSPDANPIAKALQAPLSLAQSGIYSMRGWLEIMMRTGEYKNFLDVGSGGESVASQGLRTIRGDVRRSTDLLERIKETPSKNQLDQIIKEIRTGNFREAYASILSPIADAGRVGAYLKERGRGADVIEAVYRAKKAGANFSNRGDALRLQALNRMTLFLNPAIQGLDASRHAFMKDKIGYIARGIAGITVPSMMLWAAYKDDQEIVQLRGTPTGKKFWFMRINGEIVKIPKPIFDGAVFGASAESYLDAMNKKDPDALRNWTEGMYNDAAVNLLPFVGVAPISLMTGKIVGLGSDLNPARTEGLDIEYRATDRSSEVARIVSRAVAPAARQVDLEAVDNAASPIGVDFLIQNYLGGAGSELAKLLSVAINVGQGGEVPVKQELPFVRAVFGEYPTMNTAAIQEFYRHAERAEETLNTINFLGRTNPAELPQYLETRGDEVMLADMYKKTRAQIADARKTMEDLRNAPREIVDDKTKREISKAMMELMIQQATLANSVARSMNQPAK